MSEKSFLDRFKIYTNISPYPFLKFQLSTANEEMTNEDEISLIMGLNAWSMTPGSATAESFFKQGNVCTDVSKLFFRNEEEAWESIKAIRDCTFIPDSEDGAGIFIGKFSPLDRVNIGPALGADKSNCSIALPSGLLRSTFTGKCMLSDGCRVSDTHIIRGVLVGSCAAIVSCGSVVSSHNCKTAGCTKKPSFGYGTKFNVGAENGGRELTLSEGLGFVDYCRLALNCDPISGPGVNDGCPLITPVYNTSCMCVISHGSLLHSCHSVIDTYIHANGVALQSELVNCSLQAASRVGPFAVVRNSIVSEACKIEGPCNVSDCYLGEYAQVGAGASLVSSVLGPDASVSRGECLHSLVGPFTGFHHASLLIATLWPLGRGNLGYGCMLGSNHTGKVNDQEFFPGEGCFFGLGSAVKFPCNLLGSPYSLIASNTCVPPVRLALPFSLIAASSTSDASPLNTKLLTVRPGWVLYNNPYMLERAAKKFKSRRKAKNVATDFPLLRPTTVDMVRLALVTLRAIVKCDATAVAVQSDISLQSIDKGIAAYESMLRRYALHGLLALSMLDPEQLAAVASSPTSGGTSGPSGMHNCLPPISIIERSLLSLEPVGAGGMLADLQAMGLGDRRCTVPMPSCALTAAECLPHQWLVLKELYLNEQACDLNVASVRARLSCLQALPGIELDYAKAVQACKARDDKRGIEVIPHYAATNASMKAAREAAERGLEYGDEVVVQAFSRAARVDECVQELFARNHLAPSGSC